MKQSNSEDELDKKINEYAENRAGEHLMVADVLEENQRPLTPFPVSVQDGSVPGAHETADSKMEKISEDGGELLPPPALHRVVSMHVPANYAEQRDENNEEKIQDGNNQEGSIHGLDGGHHEHEHKETANTPDLNILTNNVEDNALNDNERRDGTEEHEDDDTLNTSTMSAMEKGFNGDQDSGILGDDEKSSSTPVRNRAVSIHNEGVAAPNDIAVALNNVVEENSGDEGLEVLSDENDNPYDSSLLFESEDVNAATNPNALQLGEYLPAFTNEEIAEMLEERQKNDDNSNDDLRIDLNAIDENNSSFTGVCPNGGGVLTTIACLGMCMMIYVLLNQAGSHEL